MKSLALTLVALLALPFGASAAELILNEYNGVAPTVYLNGGTALVDDDGEAAADATLGRVLGNGGDWIELVVIADHLDIRGWRIQVCDNAVCAPELVFTNASLLANLRAGTLITIAADMAGVIRAENASYNPVNGPGEDWWIELRSFGSEATGTYISVGNFTRESEQLTGHDPRRWRPDGLRPRRRGHRAGRGPEPARGVQARDQPERAHHARRAGLRRRQLERVRPAELVRRRPRRAEPGRAAPEPARSRQRRRRDRRRRRLLRHRRRRALHRRRQRRLRRQLPTRAERHQADTGSINALGANGIGDVCECGDTDDDGRVTPADAIELREFLAESSPTSARPRSAG